MASPAYGQPSGRPAGRTAGPAPRALLPAVAGLGVVGFLFHIGPVYRGGAGTILAAQPVATWVGAGGLALLLGGLLAAAGMRAGAGAGHRDGAAVSSVLGALAVIVGLLDLPMGATTGWALIVIAVLAVLQGVLAVVVAVAPVPAEQERRPVPLHPAPQQPPPASPTFYAAEHFSPTAAPESPGRGTGSGTGTGGSQHTAPPWIEPPRHAGPADRPTAPVFTPQPSPAPSGAQPAGTTPVAGWGARAEQAGQQRGGAAGHSPEGFVPGAQ